MHAAVASTSGGGGGASPKKVKKGKKSSNQHTDWEELVEEEEESKNWKGIFIAILVIISIFSLIITAIVLVTPKVVIPDTGDELTLHEYLDGSLEPNTVDPIWSPGGHSFLYKSKDNELIWFECNANISSVFLDNSSFRELNTDEFLLSADKSFILFPHQSKIIYKHSTLTRYKLYNTDTRLYRDLAGPHGNEFQHVTWTHNGQGLIVVQENNIYYKRTFINDDEPYMQITFTGNESTIYNGVPDWLYGEEILKSSSAMWLSLDDRYLLYAEFNDTEVEEMPTIFYGDPKHKYTEAKHQRYPKVGTRNPTFQLKIFSFRDNSTKVIPTPTSFRDREHYFTSVQWRDNTSVAVIWLSRSQNVSVISICDASEAVCYENLRLEADYGWIEPPTKLIFTPARDEYFAILPRKDGENGFYKNVAKVDAATDILKHNIIGRRIFVTVGKDEVVDILHYSPDNRSIFYLAIPNEDSKQRHLYWTTSDKDTADFRQPTCITCDLGDDCKYVDAKFPPDGDFYILGCLGPDVPYFSLYAIPNISIADLETNDDVRSLIETKLMPKVEFDVIEEEGEPDLHVKLIHPAAFNKDEIFEYNLILTTNEDIGPQHVTYRFNVGWDYFMSSVHSIIMLRVDPRGTWGRGDAWAKAIFRKTGVLEMEDIIRTTRYFNAFHYVKNGVAVLGKGYGGFLAIAALTSNSNDIIQCGIVVSPITDFQYIDSFFAEKYHTGWQSSINEYNNIQLTRQLKNMEGHQLMILHGTSDGKWATSREKGHSDISYSAAQDQPPRHRQDRIHFQHSAQYVKHLISSDLDHESKIFPDKFDLLLDVKLRKHVLLDIENFLLKCFGRKRRQMDPITTDEDQNV